MPGFENPFEKFGHSVPEIVQMFLSFDLLVPMTSFASKTVNSGSLARLKPPSITFSWGQQPKVTTVRTQHTRAHHLHSLTCRHLPCAPSFAPQERAE